MPVKETPLTTNALPRSHCKQNCLSKVLNGACPRHMRFIFGQSDVGCTPLATYTESAQPIPRAPHNDFKYKDITETIQAHPHLFKIITPIHVDCLKALLQEHLNHPLVESICHGFRHGFSPYPNMDDLKLQPIRVMQDNNHSHALY